MSEIRRLKKRDPEEYAASLAKRARRVAGVHSARARGGRGWCELIVVSHQPLMPEAEHQVRSLQLEFSNAYPEVGIHLRLVRGTRTRVRPVVSSRIEGGYVVQELDCGHEVTGERLRTKRHCECCTGGEA